MSTAARKARKARQRAGTEHYYKAPKVPTKTYENRTHTGRPLARLSMWHPHLVMRWLEQTHLVKFPVNHSRKGA